MQNDSLQNQESEDEKRRVIASFMSHFDSDDDDDDIEELSSEDTEIIDSEGDASISAETIIVETGNQDFDDIFSDF